MSTHKYILASLMYRFEALILLKIDPRAKDWFESETRSSTDDDYSSYIAAVEERLLVPGPEIKKLFDPNPSFCFDPDSFLARVQRIRQEAAVKVLNVATDPATSPLSSASMETTTAAG